MKVIHSDIPESIELATQALTSGSLLIAPTESSYMLTARGDREESHNHISLLKQRPAGKPLPFIAGSLEQVASWAELSEAEKELAAKYWPGPLTLVVRKKPSLFPFLGDDFAVRVSSHPWTRAVAMKVDFPLISTSANVSGDDPLFSVTGFIAAQRNDDWCEHLELIVDCGELPHRAPSTIVRLYNGELEVLREGAISAEELS